MALGGYLLPPPLHTAVGDLHFGIAAFTGWDRLANLFLPAGYMRHRVGQKVLRAFEGAAREKRITFTMPADSRVWEVWRDGEITPWREP